MLQAELKGSHFKPINSSQNNLNKENSAILSGNGQKIDGNSGVNNNNVNNIVNSNNINSNVNYNENQNKLPGSDGIAKETFDVKPAKVRDTGIDQEPVQNPPKVDVNHNVIDASAGVINNHGAFDVANQPKDNSDIFDPKQNNAPAIDAGGIPAHVKFIDGDVEKDRQNNEIEEPLKSGESNNGILPSNDRAPMQQEYGNNNNFNNPVVNQNGIAVNQQADEPDDKPGSLKVVWDWSDFAVNFEQYIMPEQKIRRAPHATTGEPWPMPQYYITKKDKIYTIDRANFRFDIAKAKCEIVEKAIKRYKPYILEDAVEDMYDNFQHAQSTMFEDPSLKYETPLYTDAPVVSKVYIKIRKPCAKFPTAKSDESCKYNFFLCTVKVNNQALLDTWMHSIYVCSIGFLNYSGLFWS